MLKAERYRLPLSYAAFRDPDQSFGFTLNPLVALYFCVAFTKYSTEATSLEIASFLGQWSFSDNGGAIFCIKPRAVNNETRIDGDNIIDLNEYNFDTLKNIDFPICIHGNKVDKRIEAQEGVFVYYGKAELQEKYNINRQTMFPDMKGLSLEIIDKMGDEFDVRKRRRLNN